MMQVEQNHDTDTPYLWTTKSIRIIGSLLFGIGRNCAIIECEEYDCLYYDTIHPYQHKNEFRPTIMDATRLIPTYYLELDVWG